MQVQRGCRQHKGREIILRAGQPMFAGMIVIAQGRNMRPINRSYNNEDNCDNYYNGIATVIITINIIIQLLTILMIAILLLLLIVVTST